MSRKRQIAGLIAILSGLGMVLFTHNVIKLPSEAFWSNPLSIYENYALAIALAFSVPYPMWTAGVFLILVILLVYWLARKALRA